jgi:hypothetical protein
MRQIQRRKTFTVVLGLELTRSYRRQTVETTITPG